MAKIFKEKQKIIIERKGPSDYTFKSYGNIPATEVADALLGAFCKVAKYLVDNGCLTAEIIKAAAINQINETFNSKA